MSKPCYGFTKLIGKKQLLIKYGNTISLIDATYKITKYDLALFFICIKTNVGYSVVGEFVVQSETAESIAESLAMLKQWNPTWNPQYFMTDYSEAELMALENVFPNTTIYLCDFHRKQAWDHWIKDRKHGLNQLEGEELLALLRACAWAQPSSDGSFTSGYELAVDDLKKSSVWSNHVEVQQWLMAVYTVVEHLNARPCVFNASKNSSLGCFCNTPGSYSKSKTKKSMVTSLLPW